MEELLEELKALLIKHNAAIVRSANDAHSLVLCRIDGENTQEEEFDEDIIAESIEYCWHRTITPNSLIGRKDPPNKEERWK
jgi:hypothetical protein